MLTNWTRNDQFLIPGAIDWNLPAVAVEGPAEEGPTPPGELTLMHTIVTDMIDPCTITCMA